MKELLDAQRAYYQSGVTRKNAFRITALQKLQISIRRHESALLCALEADLGKSAEEAYMMELSMVYDELKYALRHLRRLSLPRFVWPSTGQFPGHGRVLRDPYGMVLILSPWNYPVQLTLSPLIAAVAAGNCVIAHPSSRAPKTAAVLDTILRQCFPAHHVCMALGDTDVARTLTSLPFDKIFFTGSPAVGREVMAAASKNLVPVTLELGGKSPAIVAADADLRLAARRILWGKTVNAGQTCIAPDYVLVQKSVENALLEALREELHRQFGHDPLTSPDLPAIISDRHFKRLCGLMDKGRLICGGQTDARLRKIAPTVLAGVSDTDPIMCEEIFGPILPVLPFLTMEEAIKRVRARPTPLAFYFFTSDKDSSRRVMRDMAFGGGCVNDCVLHAANHRMPFGGVGESGMGAYHGRAGFSCFSREKSVLFASTRIDIPVRYAPRKGSLSLLKRIMK